MTTSVLVVDPYGFEVLIRELLDQAGGYEVLTATDSFQAVQIVRSRPVDLIITDIMHGAGFFMAQKVQFLRKLSARDAAKAGGTTEILQLPVIMMSAWWNEEDLERAADLGIESCIMKPFTVEELMSRVEAVRAGSGVPIQVKGPAEVEGPGVRAQKGESLSHSVFSSNHLADPLGHEAGAAPGIESPFDQHGLVRNTQVTDDLSSEPANRRSRVVDPQATELRDPHKTVVVDRNKVPLARPAIEALGPGMEVAGCVLERELGRGGMGIVFLARQLRGWKDSLALKFLSGPSLNELPVERFWNEARFMDLLEHDHIVRVLDMNEVCGEAPGDRMFVLTMEYVEGNAWNESIRDRSVTDNVAVLRQVSKAVAYAHGKGVIHRDLKPGNVLVKRDGTAAVTDFGLAKRCTDWQEGQAGSERALRDDAFSSALTVTGAMVGTVPYMSPEQVEGARSVDYGADVWALGVILYEILTWTFPFRGETAREMARSILSGNLVPPSSLRQGVSRALESICLRALSRNPADRYPTAGEFEVSLEQAISRDPTLAQAPPHSQAQ